MAYFGYDTLLDKSVQWNLPSRVTRWVEQERERLRRELLEFPRVDHYGVLLGDPEEEEQDEEEQEKVASAGVVEAAEESRKGKERSRDQ
jgi:hypothetical protein